MEAAKKFASISSTSTPSDDTPELKIDSKVSVVADFFAFMQQGMGQLVRDCKSPARDSMLFVHADDDHSAIAHD